MYVILYTHSFRLYRVEGDVRDSRIEPAKASLLSFIYSICYSPDILFFLLKFCLYIRGVLVAYPIELSSLVEGT